MHHGLCIGLWLTLPHQVLESIINFLAGFAALDYECSFRIFVNFWLPLTLRSEDIGLRLLWLDTLGRHMLTFVASSGCTRDVVKHRVPQRRGEALEAVRKPICFP